MANAATFQYSFDFGNGDVVSGMFDGTANGNLVTGLSNISASYNGVAFNGSGSLFVYSYGTYSDYYRLSPGTGYASFDGTNNNFLFFNLDVTKAFPAVPANFFYSSLNLSESKVSTSQGSSSILNNYGNFGQYWNLTQVNPVPEPETLAMMLLGLPMIAWTVRRRKSA